MSRAMNVSMSEAQVLLHCREQKIDISVLEPLPDGGVRLVCMSSYGAAQARQKLKKHILEGEVRRERFRPRSPLW